jgi:integrase
LLVQGTFQDTFQQTPSARNGQMPRPQKPWYRSSKDAWYATVGGRRVSLGLKGKSNRLAARQAWRKAIREAEAQTSRPKPSPTVQNVVDGFLADVQSRAKPKTLEVYRYFLTPFAGLHGESLAESLTPTLAEAYSRKPEWTGTTQHQFLGALVAAFRWAVRLRLLAHNPLDGIRKPPKRSRAEDVLLSPSEAGALLSAACPAFAMFLEVLWATGSRPGEVAAICAENFDADAGLVRLAEHKTMAKTGRARAIYLPPKIVALLRHQRLLYPTGQLLRTSIGTPWNEDAWVGAMARTRRRAGLPHAIAYGLRHSFATDALANGVPDAQVAELLGHQGTAMLHKHYAHLGARANALRSALAQIRA